MINFEKYINIPFKHKGRNFNGVDCYGLLCLMLKEEKNINMPDFEYSIGWDREGCNIIEDNVKNFNSWKEIKEPDKLFDVILFYSSSSKKIVSHMGIFLGEDKFIHISTLYKSRIDRLNDHWRNRIYKTLRYNFG